MIELNWDDYYNSIPDFDSTQMKLGTLRIPLDEEIDFGVPIGKAPVRALAYITNSHSLMGWPFIPQLAMLAFLVTRRVFTLNTYFPLTKTLDKTRQKDFYRLAGDIMRQPNFKVCRVMRVERGIMGVLRAENAWAEPQEVGPSNVIDPVSSSVAEIAFFVACHIAELFFYRRDILDRLLDTPFEIRLATSAEAFKHDGGVAGGNYNPQKGCIQMMLPRLFEGYRDKTPGVAPFLHEFGHLLDHFDAAEKRLGASHGTLPGMRPDEGTVFNAKARELFLRGKRLEWDRYIHLSVDGYHGGDEFPIGHAYVFQNDTEFIAGYLEMFFRNPHYFAAQNPDLYESFRLTFNQDPRQVWAADFPFYIEQNQRYYRGLERPPKPGLTI